MRLRLFPRQAARPLSHRPENGVLKPKTAISIQTKIPMARMDRQKMRRQRRKTQRRTSLRISISLRTGLSVWTDRPQRQVTQGQRRKRRRPGWSARQPAGPKASYGSLGYRTMMGRMRKTAIADPVLICAIPFPSSRPKPIL